MHASLVIFYYKILHFPFERFFWTVCDGFQEGY